MKLEPDRLQNALHICVDMQRIFAEQTPWHAPWLNHILPNVIRLTEHIKDKSVFTRFVPPQTPDDAVGQWRSYFNKWTDMTLEKLDPLLIELVPQLVALASPQRIFDKSTYSPWKSAGFLQRVLSGGTRTVIVTGGESDICVLATVLGAIEEGLKVIVVRDAVYSGSDETHDAAMTLYEKRYSQHIQVMDTSELLLSSNPADPNSSLNRS